MAHNQPAYRITLGTQDITNRFQPRLVELSLEICRGDQADQLDITLDDHDGQLALPTKGVMLSVAIGWEGQALVDKGTFKVDDVTHSGPPDQILIRARSAELDKAIRTRAERSYHATTLGDVLKQIAGRNKLATRIDPKLAAKAVAHIDQTESDVAFLTRLARIHDAVGTIKRGTLLFLPILGTTTSSGKPFPLVTIKKSDGDQHTYESGDRENYSGVRAYWHDPKRSNRRGVLVGQSGNAKRLRTTYADEADAKAHAQAEWRRIQRGAASFDFTLALGRPDLMPQSPVKLQGWKAEIDAIDWLTDKVRHVINGSGGFTTSAHLEVDGADESEGSTVENEA